MTRRFHVQSRRPVDIWGSGSDSGIRTQVIKWDLNLEEVRDKRPDLRAEFSGSPAATGPEEENAKTRGAMEGNLRECGLS